MNEKLSRLVDTETNDENTLDATITFLNLVLIFLTPFIFLPFTTASFYEMGKFLIFAVFVFIMLALFVISSLFKKEMKINFLSVTPFIVLFIVAFLVAVGMSSNNTMSLYGNYGMPFAGTIGFIAVMGLFFLMSAQNIKKHFNLFVWAFVSGQSTASILFLLAYFTPGLIPYEPLINLATTVAGSPLTFAALGVVGTVLSIGKVFVGESAMDKVVFTALAVLMVLPLVIINSVGAWVGLIVAFIYYALKLKTFDIKKNISFVSIPLMLAVALAVVIYVPTTREGLGLQDFPRQVSITANESWEIMMGSFTVQKNFLIGYGPATYTPVYTTLKPITVNQTDFWMERFVRPYNEVFYQATAVGIIGLVILGLIAVATLVSVFRVDSDNKNAVVAAAGLAAVAVPLLFGNASTAWVIVLMTLLVLYYSAVWDGKRWGVIFSKDYPLNYLVPFSVIVIGGVMMFGTYVVYAGDFNHYKAARHFEAGETEAGINALLRAAEIYPSLDVYHREISTLNILAAWEIHQSPGLSEEEKLDGLVNTLNSAIAEAREAKDLWEESVANWELLGGVYLSAAQLLNNYGSPEVVVNNVQNAMESYAVAIQLDPRNPSLRIALGNIYYLVEDYQTALQHYTIAAQLKPDYAQARYSRGLALKELGQYVLAEEEFRITLEILSAFDLEGQEIVEAQLAEVSVLAEQQREELARGIEETAEEEFLPVPEPETIIDPGADIVDPAEQPVLDVSVEEDEDDSEVEESE